MNSQMQFDLRWQSARSRIRGAWPLTGSALINPAGRLNVNHVVIVTSTLALWQSWQDCALSRVQSSAAVAVVGSSAGSRPGRRRLVTDRTYFFATGPSGQTVRP